MRNRFFRAPVRGRFLLESRTQNLRLKNGINFVRVLLLAISFFFIVAIALLTMLASRRLLIKKVRSRYASKRTNFTTSAAEGSTIHETVERPTNKQLWRVFNRAAVPMIGFGFMDQTVMLQAGNAIDCTLGVTFGLSTLASDSINCILYVFFWS
jgi:hypothetical protein